MHRQCCWPFSPHSTANGSFPSIFFNLHPIIKYIHKKYSLANARQQEWDFAVCGKNEHDPYKISIIMFTCAPCNLYISPKIQFTKFTKSTIRYALRRSNIKSYACTFDRVFYLGGNIHCISISHICRVKG